MLVVGFKIDDTYYNQGFDLREFAYKTECRVVDLVEIRIVLRPRANRALKLEYLGRDENGDLFYIHPEENRFIPETERFAFERQGDVFISQVFPVERTPVDTLEQVKSVVHRVLQDRETL